MFEPRMLVNADLIRNGPRGCLGWLQSSGWSLALWLGALALALSGCASSPGSMPPAPAPAKPLQNVYREGGKVPPHVKRVVVLPVAVASLKDNLEEGREAMQGLLGAEFLATRRFEFVTVSREQCRAWTGRSEWLVSEELPRDLLTKIRRETGCDGVLFSQLTHYRAYAPVAVGWRMQLVCVEPLRVLWAVDELFDGGDPAVADAAKAYCRRRELAPNGSDPRSILSTPRRFGQFTAASLAGTLPER